MPPVAAAFAAISSYAAGVYAAFQASAIGTWIAANQFLANVIGSLVISVGVPLIQSLFAKKQGSNVEASKVNVRIPEPPRWLAAGEMRQGGGAVFGEFDSQGNFWYIIIHSDSILKETIKYYFDETPLTLDGAGNVTTDDFCLNSDMDVYTGTGTKVPYFQIWTTTYTEANPTPPAIAALVAAFPTLWTADHKLVGTTYSVVKCKALAIADRYKLYKWRGPFGIGEPSVGLVGKWSNAYDPRDGTQTPDVPTTYKYSDMNPVLIWAWFRTHRYGRKKAFNSINWARVAEQADICEQNVVGAYGSQERYRCGIAIPENKERSTAEQEILLTMDAQLVFDVDGKCWPRVGYWEAPTLALSRNRDIVAMESVEAQNGESETQGVIVRYMDPAANYAAQPSAAWLNPLYYVEGEAATFLTVDILGCQNHNQAMRLAKGIGLRSQSSHKLLPTVGLRGLRARQERIINLNYDNTFSGDYEIVTPVEVDNIGIFCGFGVVPIDANRWTLLPGEEKAKPVVDGAAAAPTIAVPTGVTVAYKNNRIEATFTAPTRPDVSYEFQYIRTADLSGGQWLDMSTDMVTRFSASGSVSQGVPYLVRYRALSSSGRPSAWSANVSLTPTDGAQNALDLYLDQLTVQPSDPQKARVKAYIQALIDSGEWAVKDRILFAAVHDAQAAQVDLRNPLKRWTPTGTIPWVAYRGYTGDGVSGYLDGGEALSALPHFTLNDASMSVWCRTDSAVANNGRDIGTSGSTTSAIAARSAGGNLTAAPNSANLSFTVASAIGLSAVSRTGSTASAAYKNGVSVVTSSTVSTTVGAGNLCVGRSSTSFSDRQIAFASAGGGTTPAMEAASYTANNAYLVAVGAA